MTPSRTALLLCVAWLAAAIPPEASAEHSRATSAGGACHPANGGSVAKFTRGNHVLTNTGTTDQYVICHFAMDDDLSESYTTPTYLSAAVQAGATAGTVTCVAQIGYFSFGTTIRSSFSRSAVVAANEGAFLTWDNSVPWVREQAYEVLTLNCRLPGGFKMGLVEWYD